MGRAFNFSELPDKEEGFSKIDQVEIQLICDTPYKVTEKFLLASYKIKGVFEQLWMSTGSDNFSP